ncbi:uncharacterized protein LOC131079162 isoform X2 [Cryptomeria japonica]|uniref:uncharacterized protein LOC131079162 isoform X2 n=1 Tax=Cryptomeria japonica TaxID=3369 RepID=UPI0027D9D4EA|nr:uncharacterized protein LOC131079162 isoform X2 [Cryptomeria japonica]
MQVQGCYAFKSSSFSPGNGGALSLQSHQGFSKVLFRIQMGGHLKQRSVAKVNITSAFSANTNANSPQCIAEYSYNGNRPTGRRNKLRPKLLKTLPHTQTETIIHSDQRPNVKSDNFDSCNKDFKNLEASTSGGEAMIAAMDETFSGEAVTASMDETFSGLNLQDGEDFINDFTDKNKYIDDDIHEINVEKEALKNDSSLKDKLGKLLGSWKDWYVQYKRDVLAWGVGNTPIFVVYKSGKGEVKVSINTDEIWNRCVAHPFGKDETRTTSLRLKIAEAKQHARAIERGVIKPPRNSSIYHFLDTGKEKGGILESAINRTTFSSVIGTFPAPRVLGNLQFGFFVLSCSVFVWAAWKFVMGYGSFSVEKDKLKKKQLALESLRSYMVKNRVEFEQRVQEVQDMARQVRIVEQNTFEKSDLNLKTVGTNSKEGRKKGDKPLNSKALRKNNHDVRDPDTSDSSIIGGNDRSTKPNEANIHVENNLSFQQGSEGSGSIDFRENRNRNQKSKKTVQPNVDLLQHRQSSLEKAACIATKETVSALHTKKGLDKDKRSSRKRFTENGSQKIILPVTTGVKQPRELVRSKHGKHSNKFTDASNLSNKSNFHVDRERTKQKDAIIKEKINSNGRIKKKKNRKLKPLFRKEARVVEEKIGGKKVLENVSASCLGTAESKTKLDLVNTMDKRLHIEPENGVLQGDYVLLQKEEEFKWMRDEVLRKIVSKVQTNNIAGREPSDGLLSEEELLFFRGLQRKFEREGESVKAWIKERVENLNYDKAVSWVDGSSIFSAIFLKDSTNKSRSIVSSKNNKDRKMFTTEKMIVDEEQPSFISESIPVSVSSSLTSTDFSSMGTDANCKSQSWMHMPPAEELVEYASFSTEEKLKNNEIIRDSEMVGQKKAVSKNNEYNQEMKKHLWWLDLPYVLCIGLQRNDEDNVLKGLYSLEMAPVSECSSRPQHTIAFEDHADARNFCYILQSHFHELGDTSAHVIPLSTKDFYEEAKSTSLKVTVIKKGALQLYVGQPLKEVEGRITDIGTAIYNEKKREDHEIDSVVKDVYGNKRSITERNRRKSA